MIIGFLLDREIYFYEGVHLDSRVLAQPLPEALKEIPRPFILDCAAVPGRLSSALTSRAEFIGHVIPPDLSQGMLEQAAAKLASFEQSARVEFIRHQSLPLPFPAGVFDVVCALEVLELVPNMDESIAELTRVLHRGGILLTSRGTETWGRRAKVKSETEFIALFQRNRLENVQVAKWWKLFERVFARKHGSSPPVSRRRLPEVLCCSKCKKIQWQTEQSVLRCLNCGHMLAVTKKNIALN